MRKLLYFFPILFFWASVVFSASIPVPTEGTSKETAFISVKSFGAKGDGSTDDTKAIQAAIDSLPNGTLYFPTGTYKTTNKLTLHTGIKVVGQSISGTTISSTKTTALYSPEFAMDVIIERLTIDGDFTPGTYGIHIYRNPRTTTIRDIKIKDFGASGNGGGVYLDGGGSGNTWGTLVENVEVRHSGRGFVVYNAQAITLIDCLTKWNAGPSYFEDINGLTILGGAFEYTNTNTGGNSWNLHLKSVKHAFIKSHFEQAWDGHIKIEDSLLVTIANSKIGGYSGTDMANGWLYLKNSSMCKISGCELYGLDGNFKNKSLIYLDPDSHDNIIELNNFEPDGGIGPNYHVINLGKGNIFTNNRGHQNSKSNIGPIKVLWGDNNVQAAGFTTGSERVSGVETFEPNDETPDVGNGYIFKTANVKRTVINKFDHAESGGLNLVGQEILVLIGDDNTRIDFTGTMLKGNAGSDWIPSNGDHMDCVYDGMNWFCRVSDNTAK